MNIPNSEPIESGVKSVALTSSQIAKASVLQGRTAVSRQVKAKHDNRPLWDHSTARPTPWINRALRECRRIISDRGLSPDPCEGATILRAILAVYVMREHAREDDFYHSTKRALTLAHELAPGLIQTEGERWVHEQLHELREVSAIARLRIAGGRSWQGGLAQVGRALGRLLRLDSATCARLNVRMIRAFDDTAKKRVAAKRAADRSRAEVKRRADGIVPRARDEAVRVMMASTGLSRATCYRLRAAEAREIEARETGNRATRTEGSKGPGELHVSSSISSAECPTIEDLNGAKRAPREVPEGPGAAYLPADSGSHSVPPAPPTAAGGRPQVLKKKSAPQLRRPSFLPPIEDDDDAFEDATDYDDEPEDDDGEEYSARPASKPAQARLTRLLRAANGQREQEKPLRAARGQREQEKGYRPTWPRLDQQKRRAVSK